MKIDDDTMDEPRPEAGADNVENPEVSEEADGARDNDRYLRLLAEFDNYRRRSARERDAAFETGAADLARPLLPVLDNLERALAHSDGVPEAWLEGMKLTMRQFKDALKSSGVEPVEPVGQPFDPRFHEALTSVVTDSVPAGHVMEVVTRGYRLGDRVLRPAQVVVAQEPDGDA